MWIQKFSVTCVRQNCIQDFFLDSWVCTPKVSFSSAWQHPEVLVADVIAENQRGMPRHSGSARTWDAMTAVDVLPQLRIHKGTAFA